MKVQMINDLHLEFDAWPVLIPEGDVLTVAGDLCTWTTRETGLEWLREQAKLFEHVFFVPGNHEYYNGGFHTVQNYWRNQAHMDLPDNVTVLDGGPGYIYNRVLFVGGTLWTDLDNNNPLAKLMFQNHMMDAVKCMGLDADIVIDENEKYKEDIEEIIHRNVDIPAVVLTHHLPTRRVIAPQWHGDHLNPAFANYDNWAENLLYYGNIKLWHFGHTHTPTDMEYNDCRFVCNPVGYRGYEHIKYDQVKVVEV